MTVTLYLKKQEYLDGLTTTDLQENIKAEVTIIMDKKIDGMRLAFQDAKFEDIYLEIEELNNKLASTQNFDWSEVLSLLILSPLSAAIIKIGAVYLSKELTPYFVRLNHKIMNHKRKDKIIKKIIDLDAKYQLNQGNIDSGWETIFKLHVNKGKLDNIDKILRDELKDLRYRPFVEKFLEEMGKGLLKKAEDKITISSVNFISPIHNNLKNKGKILTALRAHAGDLLEEEKKNTHRLIDGMDHEDLINTYPSYREKMLDQNCVVEKTRVEYKNRIVDFKRSVLFTGMVINSSTWTNHFGQRAKVMLPNSFGKSSVFHRFNDSLAPVFLQISKTELTSAIDELIGYCQRQINRDYLKYYKNSSSSFPPGSSVIAEAKYELVAFTLPLGIKILIECCCEMKTFNHKFYYYYELHDAPEVEEEALKRSKPKPTNNPIIVIGRIKNSGSIPREVYKCKNEVKMDSSFNTLKR